MARTGYVTRVFVALEVITAAAGTPRSATTPADAASEAAIRHQIAAYAEARAKAGGAVQAEFYTEDATDWRSTTRQLVVGRNALNSLPRTEPDAFQIERVVFVENGVALVDASDVNAGERLVWHATYLVVKRGPDWRIRAARVVRLLDAQQQTSRGTAADAKPVPETIVGDPRTDNKITVETDTAIRATLSAYGEARRSGGGPEQAEFFTEDGDEWRAMTRRFVIGRAALAKDLAIPLNPARQFHFEVQRLSAVTANVVVIDALYFGADLTPNGHAAFLAVNRGGKWLIRAGRIFRYSDLTQPEHSLGSSVVVGVLGRRDAPRPAIHGGPASPRRRLADARLPRSARQGEVLAGPIDGAQDRREHPNTRPDAAWDTHAVTRIDASRRVSTRKKAGKVIDTTRLTVLADSKTMTITTRRITPTGEQIRNDGLPHKVVLPVVDQEVLAAERAIPAAINAGDRGARSRLMADDHLETNRKGEALTKAESLALPDHPPDMAVSEQAARQYGEIVVTTGVLGWRGAPRGLRYTSVWRRGPSGWQRVVYQSSPITDTAGDATVPHALPIDPGAEPADQVIAEVQRVEEVRARAQREKSASGGNDLYRSITADDYTATTSGGRLVVKTETAGERTPYEDFQISDANIRPFGNVAVVTGTQRHRMNGKNMGPFRFTRVWVRRDGLWQVVAHQATIIQRN